MMEYSGGVLGARSDPHLRKKFSDSVRSPNTLSRLLLRLYDSVRQKNPDHFLAGGVVCHLGDHRPRPLSTIVPPFSGVITAGITIIPTAKFSAAAIISLRSLRARNDARAVDWHSYRGAHGRIASLGKSLACGSIYSSARRSRAGAGSDGADRHRRNHGGRHGVSFRGFRDHSLTLR